MRALDVTTSTAVDVNDRDAAPASKPQKSALKPYNADHRARVGRDHAHRRRRERPRRRTCAKTLKLSALKPYGADHGDHAHRRACERARRPACAQTLDFNPESPKP